MPYQKLSLTKNCVTYHVLSFFCKNKLSSYLTKNCYNTVLPRYIQFLPNLTKIKSYHFGFGNSIVFTYQSLFLLHIPSFSNLQVFIL